MKDRELLENYLESITQEERRESMEKVKKHIIHEIETGKAEAERI